MDSRVMSIRQFLAFKIGIEEYGIDILRVQEIRSYEEPTRMTGSPVHTLGVINLRGAIVPIVDLRIKFNLAQVTYDAFTVVIVINIGSQILGLVVDGVSDVISFADGQLHPVPEFNSAIGNDYLLAIGSLENRTLMLLAIDQLMQSADMGFVKPTLQ
ncbi:MAG: chemotaxis protein CheW [Comamonadaceae bacterium CG2_30_59_20]|nr:MAG: chemotaxis protein CheW [Comamonadaceae bacterium CG2_30_59_20]